MLYVLTGISGGGKTSHTEALRKKYPHFHYPVPHITRTKRDYEIPSYHYHFTDIDEFRKSRDQGEFFVWTDQSYGNHLGIKNEQIESQLRRGEDVFLETPVPLAREIVNKINPSELRIVFLRTPDTVTQIHRLLGRRTTWDDMRRRIHFAPSELAWAKEMGIPIIINEEGMREKIFRQIESELQLPKTSRGKERL